ncbi:peroxidase A2 [Selaginella moellendorffii]|nr:peroxidase A2 [Selaginella moellendorffii]|eukprot:XP_002969330.2 peroxidase A2 [Selaginella moellendorffii]
MVSWVGFSALLVLAASHEMSATLSPTFYDDSCPDLKWIVDSVLQAALLKDPRIGAKLLRMHFHDCFVQGCDASVLLDEAQGEKTAQPNLNSLMGFDVVDSIKSAVESACPGIVSCADILAVAAEVSVVLAGGPSWKVLLGRRDSLTGSKRLANRDIPPPTSTFSQLVKAFKKKGLSAEDMIVLSGGHTIGASRCASFTQRLYNQSGSFQADPTIEKRYLFNLQQVCPRNGDGNVTQSLDFSPRSFDNNYYKLVVSNLGLLNSDQVLTTQSQGSAALVSALSRDQTSFFNRFAVSMVKMGNISPLVGNKGEIRNKCRYRN